MSNTRNIEKLDESIEMVKATHEKMRAEFLKAGVELNDAWSNHDEIAITEALQMKNIYRSAYRISGKALNSLIRDREALMANS